MRKGRNSGNLENGAAARNGITRQRKDYTVHVLESDGTRVTFECGVSLTAAAKVTEAIKRYGGKRVAKMATVATDHVASVQGHQLSSAKDVDSW